MSAENLLCVTVLIQTIIIYFIQRDLYRLRSSYEYFVKNVNRRLGPEIFHPGQYTETIKMDRTGKFTIKLRDESNDR